MKKVTILILIDGFLQSPLCGILFYVACVTILILIDGFLQYECSNHIHDLFNSHNPYFNRWFSTIPLETSTNTPSPSHNPYFNRWFSAIKLALSGYLMKLCHNPYFNRWFSAMELLES